jgi:hypothetical protein
MKNIEYDELLVDEDIPKEHINQIRKDLLSAGYKCYFDPETNEHYWINRDLGEWERKELILVNKS